MFKSKKGNCSRRTRAASMRIEQQMVNNTVDVSRKKLRVDKKKDLKIDRLEEIVPSISFSVSSEKCAGQFYSATPELSVYDSTDGGVMWLDKEAQIFAAILIPRTETLEHLNAKIMSQTVSVLNELHATEKSINRGSKAVGRSSSKYVVAGNKIQRGAHGFSSDKLSKEKPRSSGTLKRVAKRMEHITCKYVPSRWLRAITNASKVDAWPAFGKCSFSAAMATAKNYSSPAHIDQDFVFSILQITSAGLQCSTDDPPCQHFCFPEFGRAIALRPGDVLLFNPHVYHCMAPKTAHYQAHDVHATSLYTKTGHVGLNNNSIELTEEQQRFELEFS